MRETLGSNSRLLRSCPSIATLEGAGPKWHIFAALNLKSEIFLENLKIHVGGDDPGLIRYLDLILGLCKEEKRLQTNCKSRPMYWSFVNSH